LNDSNLRRLATMSRQVESTIRGYTDVLQSIYDNPPEVQFDVDNFLSSLAIRSSPQETLSAAICRINSRRFCGRRGRPDGFDFQRQKSRNPLRCQRMNVSDLTFTSALRHGNIRPKVAIDQRVASFARRGLTLRSWKRELFAENKILGSQGLVGTDREGSKLGQVKRDRR
jgi:hypothetical protein